MKISSLHLYNFLSHADTMLALDKITSIRGENGAGKTSIEQALEMLYTGRSSSTDDKGAGSRDLIRRGQDKSAITAEIQDAKLLGARTAKMRCSLTEKSGRTIAIKDADDPAWTGSEFLTALATKREILDCLINGRYFIEMDDARQKKLLAGIILPTSVVWDDWVESAVNQCGLQVDWSLKAFDLISLAWKRAYDERTLANRMIKDWKEPDPAPAQIVDVAEIRAKLKERQDASTAAEVERQRLFDKWETAKNAKGRLGAKLEDREGKLRLDIERKDQAQNSLLSKGSIKEAEKLAKGEQRAKEIDAAIEENAVELRDVRKMLAKLNDLAETETCPTCTQPVTEAELENIVAPYMAKQDALLTAERKLQDDRKALGDWQGAVKVLADHVQAEKDLKLIESHIADTEKEINEIRAEMGSEAKIPSPDTSEVDAKIADLDSRIVLGNQALTAAIQAEANRKHYADTMEAKKKMDAKVAILERLVEYFGPKGIQAKLLDEHVGGFEASMNQTLKAWGFEAHLQFEPFSFGISFDGREQVYTLRTISKSQRHMFSVAFQVALSKVSGFNFVVVDEGDVFLDQNRSALYKSLIGAGLDQVIVLQSDTRREVPKVPGAVFYMMSLDRTGEVPATVVERLS